MEIIFMKFNQIASGLILVTAVFGSNAAFAWSWSGTVGQWETLGTINDGDNDTAFTMGNSGLGGNLSGQESNVKVNIAEFDIHGVDTYSIGFDLPGTGYRGNGGTFNYSVSTTDNPFNQVRIDSVVQDSVEKVKAGFSGPTLPLITLITASGNPAGPLMIPAQSLINVVDTLSANGGVISHVDNQIGSVPEPMTMLLIAIGFAGFGFTGRKLTRQNGVL
jgi:hypothetical protein